MSRGLCVWGVRGLAATPSAQREVAFPAEDGGCLIEVTLRERSDAFDLGAGVVWTTFMDFLFLGASWGVSSRSRLRTVAVVLCVPCVEPSPGAWIVEITNMASIEGASTSINNGAAGSVKWMSRSAPAASAKAIVACIGQNGVDERLGITHVEFPKVERDIDRRFSNLVRIELLDAQGKFT